MAVYTENTMTWCECDNCHITMFAGFNANPMDVKHSFEHYNGWSVGKRVLCNYCAKDPDWQEKEYGPRARRKT